MGRTYLNATPFIIASAGLANDSAITATPRLWPSPSPSSPPRGGAHGSHPHWSWRPPVERTLLCWRTDVTSMTLSTAYAWD